MSVEDPFIAPCCGKEYLFDFPLERAPACEQEYHLYSSEGGCVTATGNTHLMKLAWMASHTGAIPLMQKILSRKGCNINTENSIGFSALYMSTFTGSASSLDAVRLLLDCGAKVPTIGARAYLQKDVTDRAGKYNYWNILMGVSRLIKLNGNEIKIARMILSKSKNPRELFGTIHSRQLPIFHLAVANSIIAGDYSLVELFMPYIPRKGHSPDDMHKPAIQMDIVWDRYVKFTCGEQHSDFENKFIREVYAEEHVVAERIVHLVRLLGESSLDSYHDDIGLKCPASLISAFISNGFFNEHSIRSMVYKLGHRQQSDTPAVAQLLLDSGAQRSINVPTLYGVRPVEYLITRAAYSAVKVLISNGAIIDINCVSRLVSNNSIDLEMLAIILDSFEINTTDRVRPVELLSSNLSKPNAAEAIIMILERFRVCRKPLPEIN